MNTTWRYETAEDLDQPLSERLRHFPREPDILVYTLRSATALIIRAWLRTYHRLRIVGRENLPGISAKHATGVVGAANSEEMLAKGAKAGGTSRLPAAQKYRSFVLVANHSSHLDALCLLAALPLRKLHRAFPAAAADYFFESIPRTWFSAVIVNALPFARQVQIRQSLALCEHLLLNPGNVLILFPEGTRSMTGEVGRFKPGIGLLLAGRDLPVVPCYLDGAFRAFRKGQWVPRPRQITLRIGAPKNYSHVLPGKESACQIAEELRKAVLELTQNL